MVALKLIAIPALRVTGSPRVEALLGTLTLAKPNQRIGVKRQIPHEQWHNTPENDIALLELDGPAILIGEIYTEQSDCSRSRGYRTFQ